MPLPLNSSPPKSSFLGITPPPAPFTFLHSACLRRGHLMILLLLGGLRLVAQNGSNGSIHGQVSNAATRNNLQGARITLIKPGTETVSARDGTFEFSGLAPGIYSVTIDYPTARGADRRQALGHPGSTP